MGGGGREGDWRNVAIVFSNEYMYICIMIDMLGGLSLVANVTSIYCANCIIIAQKIVFYILLERV